MRTFVCYDSAIRIKYLLLIFFISIMASVAEGQVMNMFHFEKSQFNPAWSGMENKFDATFMGHNQWLGMAGTPWYLEGNTNLRSELIHGGVGFNFKLASEGFFRSNEENINYTFDFRLPGGRCIGLGIATGLTQLKIDFGDEGLYYPDFLLNQKALNTGYGISYHGSHIDLGLSAMKKWTRWIHGYKFNFPDYYQFFCSARCNAGSRITLIPDVLLRANSDYIRSNLQVKTSLILQYNKRIWGGVVYIPDWESGLIFGVSLFSSINLGYSFSFNPEAKTNGDVHGNQELMVRYFIK